MPFDVEAIQVDGGSEFMAEFEDACQRRGLKLYVLPPKSPQMNGGVERGNGAWRYGALGGLTPHEYLQATKAKAAAVSQMT